MNLEVKPALHDPNALIWLYFVLPQSTMNLEVKPALHDPNALDDLISLCSDLCVFALNVALFVNSFLKGIFTLAISRSSKS